MEKRLISTLEKWIDQSLMVGLIKMRWFRDKRNEGRTRHCTIVNGILKERALLKSPLNV